MPLGRLDLARGDRGCCELPTVARCAVESARGVEVDLEAHLRASDAIGRQLDGNEMAMRWQLDEVDLDCHRTQSEGN